MNDHFRELIADLEPCFQRLMAMEPVKAATLPRGMPTAGVYVFSEGGRHLYVGRTNRLRARLQQHCRPSSGHGTAPFAFRLAREQTGQTTPSYRREGSRQALEQAPEVAEAFSAAKARVREMDVRYVAEADPVRQALLEIYVAVALHTPYNDFDTH